ncbi:hypothetical protein AB205_0045470 [Aquarana catesbeiana]|uniref:Uncharacterized protein n=1 Tax=Aquarana catesbeiana TaxID=8400 RepID=A0A2G9QMW0_AQUCT|nr:hypothetical protein AB205_0045470 [Aquarana catesbeiana]
MVLNAHAIRFRCSKKKKKRKCPVHDYDAIQREWLKSHCCRAARDLSSNCGAIPFSISHAVSRTASQCEPG